MSKTIDEILAPKPAARPRIYAYAIADAAHTGLLKIGQTTRDVKQRVAEQLKTAAIQNYTIVLDESAEREDGTIFSDHPCARPSAAGSTPRQSRSRAANSPRASPCRSGRPF